MKYKKIPNEYFVTILDRLTRFDTAKNRYSRVFDDIINKFAIDVKLKDLDLNKKIELVENIFEYTFNATSNDSLLNNIMLELEKKYFIYSDISYQYLLSRVNLKDILNKIEYNDDLPKNIKWLFSVKNENLIKNRIENSLLYPIEKIVLCEGQTELILLNTLSNLCGYSFSKNGILLIAPGGKNQVGRKFYEMVEYTKLPFFILLDKDAIEIKNFLVSKMRPIDKIYLINSGEFEDLIPVKVILNAINKHFSNELNCKIDDFKFQKMTDNLDNIYKKYGFGDFKKAEFSKILLNYIEKHCSKDDFIDSEIIDIVNCLKSS